MRTIKTADGTWTYVTKPEKTAKAIIAPTGNAYLLPIGFSLIVRNGKATKIMVIVHSVLDADKKPNTTTFSFTNEKELKAHIGKIFTQTGLDELGAEVVNGSIPFRKANKKLKIALDDVLVPDVLLQHPFPSFEDLVRYFKIRFSARTWPLWVKEN